VTNIGLFENGDASAGLNIFKHDNNILNKVKFGRKFSSSEIFLVEEKLLDKNINSGLLTILNTKVRRSKRVLKFP
jgi:hypothetical protein